MDDKYDFETVHNFLTEKKWMLLFGGYSHFEKNEPGYFLYLIYRVLILLVLLFTISMSYIGAALSYGNLVQAVHCVYTSLVFLPTILSLASRLSRHFTPLYWTMENLKEGVFLYDENYLDEEYNQIKKKYVSAIRLRTTYFGYAVILAGFSNLTLVPVMNYVIIEEDTSERMFNPYLPPLPMYLPFNTRTFIGFTLAYLIYTVLVIMLKSSFETVLGHSIFLIITLAAFVCAVHITLIVESPGFFDKFSGVATLGAELSIVSTFCSFGERIIDVSNKTRNFFYSIPWYNCDRRLKINLSTVISNTLKPTELKAVILDVPASMDTFGTVISTMYKIINVLRST